MPEFSTPFAVLAEKRKLTKPELIRAIRFMIAAEYEAIQSCICSLLNQPTISLQ